MTVSAYFSPGQYQAQQARQAITAGLVKTSAATVSPRDGIIAAGAAPGQVAAVSGLTVSVKPLQAAVSGWVFTSDAIVYITLAAASTTARTDLIILRIQDTEAGDPTSVATIEAVTGTSAAVPALPSTRCLVLAQISVAASALSVSSGNITDRRVFTAAAGDTVPIAGAFAAPALAAGLPDFTPVWDDQVQLFGIKRGGAIAQPMNPFTPAENMIVLSGTGTQPVASATWTPLNMAVTELVSGSGFGANFAGVSCSFDGWVQMEGFYTLDGDPRGARRIIGLGPTSSQFPNPTNKSETPLTTQNYHQFALTETFQVSAGDRLTVWAWQDSTAILGVGYRKIVVKRVA